MVFGGLIKVDHGWLDPPAFFACSQIYPRLYCIQLLTDSVFDFWLNCLRIPFALRVRWDSSAIRLELGAWTDILARYIGQREFKSKYSG